MIAFILFGICVCNWSQFGHDERNTFQSKYVSKNTDGWEVDIEGYGPADYTFGSNPFFMDDKTGLVWLIYQNNLQSDKSQVTAIDTETGKVQFDTSINYMIGFEDVPVLTHEGDLVYLSYGDGFQTVKPDGSSGWNFKDTKMAYSAISDDDIIITAVSNNQQMIGGVKYGAGPSDYLWTTNLSSTIDDNLGIFAISGSNQKKQVYFTEESEPVHFWIIGLEDGKIIQKKSYPYGSNDFVSTKFTVDTKNSVLYFIDNWSTSENSGPNLLAMKDPSLEKLWNLTIHTGKREITTYCDFPLLTYPSGSQYESSGLLSILCSIFDREEPTDYLFIIDPSSSSGQGSVLNKLTFTGDHSACGEHSVLFDDQTVVIMCKPVNQYGYPDIPNYAILKVDLLTGKMDKLVGGESFCFYPFTDSSGCIYYITCQYAKEPMQMKKKCF